MSSAPQSPYLVPFDGSFQRAAAPTAPPTDTPGKKQIEREEDRS